MISSLRIATQQLREIGRAIHNRIDIAVVIEVPERATAAWNLL